MFKSSTAASAHKMSNKVTSDLLSEDNPAIAHELNELYRRYSIQRSSRLSNKAAAPKERSSARNDCALPAPARFTRKAKPISSEIKDVSSFSETKDVSSFSETKDGSSVSDNSGARPGQSARQTCKTCAIELDGTYDARLWNLMHFDCGDCCRMYISMTVNLDEQLKVAS